MKARAAGRDDCPQYNFEWDADKADVNRKKHDTNFVKAATVFSDPRMLTIYDVGHSEREYRWITLGSSAAGRILVVCHTYREEPGRPATIRGFSVRKATRLERQQYEQ